LTGLPSGNTSVQMGNNAGEIYVAGTPPRMLDMAVECSTPPAMETVFVFRCKRLYTRIFPSD
jgi:hypothetical protein